MGVENTKRNIIYIIGIAISVLNCAKNGIKFNTDFLLFKTMRIKSQ